VQALRRE
jgi:hypothetical protein